MMAGPTTARPTPSGCASSLDSATAVLSLMARAVLGSNGNGVALGGIALRPHQVDALARVRALMGRYGGALLADEVGLGKTYVALALMRDARAPVVVAPAALRPMWTQALARSGLAAPLLSVEALSRGRTLATRPDLVVVDEAHHVRTPTTRRYHALAALCAGVRVMLMSATPVHNHAGDLGALLALFLGGEAYGMAEAELTRFVVRHTRADAAGGGMLALPVLAAARWIEIDEEPEILDALTSLPPPVPPADGDDPGALVTHTLVRQWASSRGALRGALRRRLAASTALEHSLLAGRLPTRAELATWTHAEGVVQLAFAELVAATPSSAPAAELLAAVRAHADAVRNLLTRLSASPDPDEQRAAALRTCRAAHPGARIVAFAERAETVHALYARLKRDRGVAVLSAQGGRVAGGRCSRAEILARFAPVAHGLREPADAERVELLLTTDLLSEGVNLQDASVVVHLDLPWTPARLEQRVGRVRRLGSRHDRVFVYGMRPPASAERLLEVERRLRRKLAIAGRTVGLVGAVLPSLVVEADPSSHEETPASAAEETTLVRTLLAAYAHLPPSGLAERGDGMPVAAVAASENGLLALVSEGGEHRLIASIAESPVGDGPALVRHALSEATLGSAPALSRSRDLAVALELARERAAAWCRARAARSLSGVLAPHTARSRRKILERIATIGSSTGRHRRAPLASLLTEARRAAVAPLGIGAERVLDALTVAPLDDEGWLRAIATFGRLHAPGGALSRDEIPRALALIVLVRDESRAGQGHSDER